jgi:DNA-directed RNA polymerase sigma subunit (sigma70/sigma32)
VNGGDENLDRYLSDVRSRPIFSAADEPGLLSACRDGDEGARTRLVNGYLELVALLALRLAPIDMRPLDAIQEANVVLIRLLEDESVTAPSAALTSALVRHYEEIQRRHRRPN